MANEMEEGDYGGLIHYSKGVYVVLIPSYRKGYKDILIFGKNFFYSYRVTSENVS